jgi:hypothetical protein
MYSYVANKWINYGNHSETPLLGESRNIFDGCTFFSSVVKLARKKGKLCNLMITGKTANNHPSLEASLRDLFWFVVARNHKPIKIWMRASATFS